MRNKKEIVYFILILSVILGFMIGINHIEIGINKEQINLQPLPVGTQTVEWVKDFSATTPDSYNSGHPWVGNNNVYPFDGSGGFGWDFDGDGEIELAYGTGERLGLIDENGQHLLFVPGIGNLLWRGDEPHVARVGNNKYVGFVLEDDCPNISPCPSSNWYQFKEISAYSFFDDSNYYTGQKIGNIQFNPSVSSAQAPTGMWILGDTLALPGETANIFLADRDFNYIQINELVNDNGVLTFNFKRLIGPVNSPTCPGCTNRGNGISYYEFYRQDENGNSMGLKDKLILTNDLIRVSDGQIVGSWLNTNGISVPFSHTSGNFVMNWDYTVSHHVDSTVAFNAGTDQQPDYRIIVMDDNGQSVSARIVIDTTGQATLIPLWITKNGAYNIVLCSTSYNPSSPLYYNCNTGVTPPSTCTCGYHNPESIALSKVKGLPGGPHLINGALVFDAKTGVLLADMNIGITQNENDKVSLTEPEVTMHGYGHGKWFGFESLPFSSISIFAQTLPEVAPLTQPKTGTEFDQVGQSLYGTGPSFYNYWGQPGSIEKYIEIDSSGNVFEGWIRFRDQQYASVLKLVNDVPVWNVATQEEKDVLFDYVQEGRHTRAGNSWRPIVELQSLQVSSGIPVMPSGLNAGLS